MSKLEQILAGCRYEFPDPILTDQEGIGLVAMGADLAPETLISAYSQGLFPWFNEDEAIAWWSPEPRCVVAPVDYKPSKSLRRTAKQSNWYITVNQAFEEVIHACSLPRSYSEDTWIHDEMIVAYLALHQLGFAHSIEVWQYTESTPSLVGGLYGLKIGNIYFGESMFHRATDASKVAFWALMRLCETCDMPLVDCQLPNDHLLSLGAKTLPRSEFLNQLASLVSEDSTLWQANSFAPLTSQQLVTGKSWQAP